MGWLSAPPRVSESCNRPLAGGRTGESALGLGQVVGRIHFILTVSTRSLHLRASKPGPAGLPVFLPFLPLAKGSCGCTMPVQKIQNSSPNLNHLGTLIISAEFLLPCNIFTVLRVRLWHLPGAHKCAHDTPIQNGKCVYDMGYVCHAAACALYVRVGCRELETVPTTCPYSVMFPPDHVRWTTRLILTA